MNPTNLESVRAFNVANPPPSSSLSVPVVCDRCHLHMHDFDNDGKMNETLIWTNGTSDFCPGCYSDQKDFEKKTVYTRVGECNLEQFSEPATKRKKPNCAKRAAEAKELWKLCCAAAESVEAWKNMPDLDVQRIKTLTKIKVKMAQPFLLKEEDAFHVTAHHPDGNVTFVTVRQNGDNTACVIC